MRIVVGELRNDLVTNSSVVGMSPQAISGQTILQLQFFDYVMSPLVPTYVDVLNTGFSSPAFRITAENSSHRIGTFGETSRVLPGNWKTTNNSMEAIAPETAETSAINRIYDFQLTELSTDSKVYTKFKFIQ